MWLNGGERVGEVGFQLHMKKRNLNLRLGGEEKAMVISMCLYRTDEGCPDHHLNGG